ncbi:MAG: ABC transporter substrate-binding protein [Deltaproteobacteria bacterium]|nr:ABC transporter substrate-binding protein [Deltaproteobacteria bacterium]
MLLSLLIIGLYGEKKSLASDMRIVDDLGQRITLPHPAMRIIALYGAYNEILAAMGLEERLVGRTKADSLPPSILSKPSIGTHMRPNVEMILGLKPDLIIQSAGRKDSMTVVHQLKDEGLQAAVFHPINFENLFSVIERLGVLTGESSRAEELIDSLQSRLTKVEHRLQGINHRPRVFFEVRYPNLLAAGRGSIVNDIILRAGGVNCIEHKKKLVRIGMDTLIKQSPEVYIIQRGPMNKNPSNPSERPNFHVLGPVKTNKIMFVDEQVYSRPGPRSVRAVEALAAFLHPDRLGP